MEADEENDIYHSDDYYDKKYDNPIYKEAVDSGFDDYEKEDLEKIFFNIPALYK